jgi:accessory gene regulator B
MISDLARYYSDILVKNSIILEEDREIHEYGLTAFLVLFSNYGIIIFLAASTGTLSKTVVFLLTYGILRSIIGGWHARSPLLCTFCGIMMWSIVMLLVHYLLVPKWIFIVLTLVSFGTLTLLIRKSEISEKRKRFGMIGLALLTIIMLILYSVATSYSYLILYSILCNVVMKFLSLQSHITVDK